MIRIIRCFAWALASSLLVAAVPASAQTPVARSKLFNTHPTGTIWVTVYKGWDVSTGFPVAPQIEKAFCLGPGQNAELPYIQMAGAWSFKVKAELTKNPDCQQPLACTTEMTINSDYYVGQGQWYMLELQFRATAQNCYIDRGSGGTGGFKKLPGAANDISVGANGTAWVIGTNPQPGGYDIYRWNGSAWQQIPGGATRIAVDPQGNAWVVQSTGQVFRWGGSSWTSMPGGLSDIGIGANGSVWAIGALSGGNGQIWEWVPSAGNWRQVPGGATRIAVAPNGVPWVVNSSGSIYRWNGSSWDQVPGGARDIGIGKDGSVWVIGGAGNLFKYNGSSWDLQTGNLAATNISVDASGKPWFIDEYKSIFQWE